MEFLDQTYPETPVPLNNKNIFELLIAVLLSAQCTDERVNKVTPSLFKMADNPFDMEKVPIDKIYNIIRPCGLAPQKSKAISNLSKILVNKFNGVVPNDINELEKPQQIWQSKILSTLKSFTEPTIIFSHFMVINIVVSTLKNDPRVVSFYPDNCSITEIENNESTLNLISIGNELQTHVN